MKPTISVIIPAYNAGETLPSTLYSILAQSDAADEIIVVDDGSTDNTYEVALEIAPAATVIKQNNKGSAAARQLGSSRATSEYIAYLDADDQWLPDTLAVYRQLISEEAAQQRKIFWLMADLDRAKPGDSNHLPRNSTFFPWMWEWMTTQNRCHNERPLYNLKSRESFHFILRGFPVFPSVTLVHKAALEQVGGWREQFRRCQDFDLGIRLSQQYPLHYLHEVRATLGLHQLNSNLSRYLITQLNGDITVLKSHLRDNRDMDDLKAFSIALSRKRMSLASTYRQQKQFQDAASVYMEELEHHGIRLKSVLGWIWSKSNAILR